MGNIGGSVQDELLRVSGSTNNPFQNIDTDTNGSAVYYGEDRLVGFRLVVAGTVSGTSPTLDVTIQDSADGVTGWNTIATFTQVTASQATASGALSEPPKVVARTRTGKPYLRTHFDVGGTTPVFNSVAVLHDPIMITAP